MNLLSPACCCDVEIDPLYLLFPDRLDDDSQLFMKLHGIDQETLHELQCNMRMMDNGKVRIVHRCNQLAMDGRCRIYEHRPKICRDFDCSKRTDCACGGKGWISQS